MPESWGMFPSCLNMISMLNNPCMPGRMPEVAKNCFRHAIFWKAIFCGLQVRARFSFNASPRLSNLLFKDTSELLVSFACDGQSGKMSLTYVDSLRRVIISLVTTQRRQYDANNTDLHMDTLVWC